MKKGYANASRSHGVLTVQFAPSNGPNESSLQCILDMNDFGDILGIEVLDWQKQAGGPIGQSPAQGPARWTYDDEVDALYVRLEHGSARIQTKTAASARRDERGLVVALEVQVPDPQGG